MKIQIALIFRFVLVAFHAVGAATALAEDLRSEPYVLGVVNDMVCAPVFVADKQGFWEKQGIKVRVLPFNDHEELCDALAGRYNAAEGRRSLGKKAAMDFTIARLGDIPGYRAAGQTDSD